MQAVGGVLILLQCKYMKQSQDSQQDYLSSLNPQQLDAVLCPSDIVFVSAGPGTGKTHLLTSKLVHSIQSSSSHQSIVALSYTNTAARQLGSRLKSKLTECGVAKDYNIYSGTIHSFCYRMLKQYYADLQLTILDDEELSELAADIKDSFGGEYQTPQILQCLKADSKELSSDLYAKVTNIKDSLQVISIQDILVLFINALEEDEQFRQWLMDKMTIIAVDEAQDLSELNYTILDILIGIVPGLKVFLVGDPRQNIFEFNGGSYKNLNAFLSKHPHTLKTLTITYRCGQSIADYVNTFRFNDCPNYKLQSHCLYPGEVTVRKEYSERNEALAVLDQIQSEGELRNCAVLCNNLKYLSTIVSLLIENGIPYRVFGGRKLLKKHIRFLNHVLRIIDTENAYSIRKVAQYANIDIMQDGKRKKSKFFASDFGQTLLVIRDSHLPFTEIVDRVIRGLLSSPDDDDRIADDYASFLSIAEQFSSIQDYLATFVTDKDLFAQFYEADYEDCPFPVGNDFLTISTIHSAKGLEWEKVFIMGLSEGVFPNEYFCQNLPIEEQKEFFNNEWKKMYVAATRAKDTLQLTYSSTITRKGYTFNLGPSRFIANI